MKAIVHYDYGSPDVLQCRDIEKPAAADNEVLIRVRAASVNPLDCGSLQGVPYVFRLMFGLRRPSLTDPGRPGVDLAGTVEAVGRNVTGFKPGDDVFGVCIRNPRSSGAKVWVQRQGSFAEYVCAPEATLVVKPDSATFEQAASVPVAGFTALQALRDKGHIRPGQKVLINGAAGGVGTFAVQIAKSFGAEVTGVCSTANVDMVRSIGADRVIDYTQEDFTRQGRLYDLVLDCVGNHPLSACRRVLSPDGICVIAGDLSGRGVTGMVARLVATLVLSRFPRRKLVAFLAKPNKTDLTILRELLQAGRVKPVIDRRYSLTEVPQAFRYLAKKHARGKVVIALDSGQPA
jgi:NADPH:quinone reductase-like Zn-dependent oxidoreductase